MALLAIPISQFLDSHQKHVNHDVHASTLLLIDHVLFFWLGAIENVVLSLNNAFLFNTFERTLEEHTLLNQECVLAKHTNAF